jgi:hypothetical protein
MKSRTLAGVAAVGVLAIVVAVTLFFRDNDSDSGSDSGPHVRRRAARHPR